MALTSGVNVTLSYVRSCTKWRDLNVVVDGDLPDPHAGVLANVGDEFAVREMAPEVMSPVNVSG